MLSQIVAVGWLPLAIVVSLLYTACVAAVAYDCGHARASRGWEARVHDLVDHVAEAETRLLVWREQLADDDGCFQHLLAAPHPLMRGIDKTQQHV